MKVMLILLISLLSSDVQKPRISLTLTPRMSFVPVSVLAVLLIINPDRNLYGADITWDWGNGSKSYQASDIDPDADLPDRWVESRSFPYRAPGTYIVTTTLSKANRIITFTQSRLDLQ